VAGEDGVIRPPAREPSQSDEAAGELPPAADGTNG
jgi:hypothetical protein